MATARQEQIYNDIIQYYNYIDELIRVAEDSSHELSEEQFNIIEETIKSLEKSADFLANEYIEYIKYSESDKLIEATRSSLSDISARVEECRNKILMLYNKKENNE